MFIFDAVIKETRGIILPKTVTKNLCPFQSYVNLFNVEAFMGLRITSLSFKKIFNHNVPFCDDTDDFNFYKYI